MKRKKVKKLSRIFIVLLLAILVTGLTTIVILLLTKRSSQHLYLPLEQVSQVSSCTQSQIVDEHITFSCSGYTLILSKEWQVTNYELVPEQLPKGWLQSGKIANAEFANYDEAHPPKDTQNIKKFGFYVIPLDKDLNTIAKVYATTQERKIISVNSLTIGKYSGVKLYSQHPMGQNVSTYFMKDSSSNRMAVIEPIFGFSDSNDDFQEQVLSNFRFSH